MAFTNEGGPGGQMRSKEAISGGATGSWIKIDKWPFTVRLICGANTGKVQYTTALRADIDQGADNASDWSRGVVTGTVTDIPEGPVSAVRGVSAAGAIQIEVVQ